MIRTRDPVFNVFENTQVHICGIFNVTKVGDSRELIGCCMLTLTAPS